jgi:hypothetical protein
VGCKWSGVGRRKTWITAEAWPDALGWVPELEGPCGCPTLRETGFCGQKDVTWRGHLKAIPRGGVIWQSSASSTPRNRKSGWSNMKGPKQDPSESTSVPGRDSQRCQSY